MTASNKTTSEQTKVSKDPWRGRDFGNFVKKPRLLSLAFLPGLTFKNLHVLQTLFAELMETYGKTGDPEVRIKRSELRVLSGLGSDAAVTEAIKGIKQAGYITSESKFPNIDLSPLLDSLECRAREKKSANLTFLKMAQLSRKLTKSVRKPNNGLGRNASNINEFSASPTIFNTSSEEEITDKDIDWGGNTIRGTEKYRRESNEAADRAFESIEDDKEFRKEFGDEVADQLYEHADIIEGISNEHISKAMRLMIGGWANDIDEALKLGASPNADDFLDQSRMLLTPTAAD